MKLKKVFLTSALAMAFVITGCTNDTATEDKATKTETEVSTEKAKDSQNKDNPEGSESKEEEKSTKDASDKEAKTMAGEELDKIQEDNKLKEKYLVIDVRDAEEYEQGHVKHAINIPVDELENRLAEIENYKDRDIVTICNTGKKSAKGQEILLNNGFNSVFNADGVKEYEYTTITKVKSVLAEEFKKLVEEGNATVIDFREEKDYNQGHLKDAINSTPDDILDKLDQIPKDKPVLTYCYSGNKSFVGADKLVNEGYDVTNAIDGTKEYDGYELVK